PCPCGRSGDPQSACSCSPQALDRYRTRLSQPLLDRLDLHIHMPAVKVDALLQAPGGETSAAIRKRASAARASQRLRYMGLRGVYCNAQIPVPATQSFCAQEPEASSLLHRAMDRFGLSARVYHRVLRIARTIADLAMRDRLAAEDVAEALQ